MSTRVQKGGPIFRPVAKPRPRFGSEARQTSAAPGVRVSAGPNGVSHARAEPHAPTPAPSASDDSYFMPPPATVPHKPPQPASSRPSISSAWGTPQKPDEPATFTIATPTRTSMRPPPIHSSPPRPPTTSTLSSETQAAAVPIVTPSRNAPPRISVSQSGPAPPVIASQSKSSATPLVPPLAPLLARPAYNAEAIGDSQIDPALIKAVVTALRHVDAENAAPSQPNHILTNNVGSTGASSQTVAVEIPPAPAQEYTSQGKGRRSRPQRSARQAEKAPATEHEGSEGTPPDATGGEDQDFDTQVTKKRKRNPNAAPRKRRSRAPSVVPYDIDADPGDEIDPTAVTMAELCEDTGRGRVSSKAATIMNNHAAWRAANREKRALMRAKMEAKKYGRNPDEEENAENAPTEPASSGVKDAERTNATPGPSGIGAVSRAQSAEPDGAKGDDYDYTQAMSTSRYNVQVRIGPNGETIIDETSLFVDRHEEDDTAGYTHIEESDATKFVNSSTYSKKLRGSRWSAEETELFYDALCQFGENYELISLVLPGRDRKACKNKFKAEDKRNSGRITYCLKNRRPYDMATLSRMTGKDFSGPTPDIRAPTPLRMPETPQTGTEAQSPPSMKTKKQSRSPPTLDQDAEILGDIEQLSNEQHLEPS